MVKDKDTSILRQRMLSFVQECVDSEVVSDIPQEWLYPSNQPHLVEMTEQVLGDKADWWLHNHIFTQIKVVSDYDSEVSSPDCENELLYASDLAKSFMQNNAEFIAESLAKVNKNPRINSDEDQIYNGIMNGICYALNEPQKEKHLDQRLNFFASFPSVLTVKNINKFVSNKRQAALMSTRIEKCLNEHKFTFARGKGIPSNFVSVYSAGKEYENPLSKRERLICKRTLIKVLHNILEPSSEYSNDGLFDYVNILSESGQCAQLQKFVYFHILNRILDSRHKEGQRKQKEQSLDKISSNINKFDSDKSFTPTELSLKETQNEDGTVTVASGKDYLLSRKQTFLEKKQIADAAKKFANEELSEVAELVDYICDYISEKNKANMEKDLISDKDKLLFIQCDVLKKYMDSALRQVDELIIPKNQVSDTNAKDVAVYKIGKAAAAWTSTKGQDLSKLVDKKALDKELSSYKNMKVAIYRQYMLLKVDYQEASAEAVQQALQNRDIIYSLEDIEQTIYQIKCLCKPSKSGKFSAYGSHNFDDLLVKITRLNIEGNDARAIGKILDLPKYVIEDILCEKLNPFLSYTEQISDTTKIRIALSWRWHPILEALYVPVEPLETIDGEQENGSWYNLKPSKRSFLRKKSCNKKELAKLNHKEKAARYIRYSVARKLKRAYHQFPSDTLLSFASMINTHAYILQGSIPENQVYKNRNCPDPGAAWSHSNHNGTGESLVKMYYDIFHEGLDRDNEDHKAIRSRCAEIIKIKRAKKIK